ncbi:MAG: hypothetical protein JW878_00235 [Methanomicrobia archaeon]|nr:hypothetical protein [Methanomicrobia archaeon]
MRKFREALLFAFLFVTLASLALILFLSFPWVSWCSSLGFSPTTHVYTALETMMANLCLVPPLVGWLWGGPNQMN